MAQVLGGAYAKVDHLTTQEQAPGRTLPSRVGTACAATPPPLAGCPRRAPLVSSSVSSSVSASFIPNCLPTVYPPTLHRGISLRFPRFITHRADKSVEDASGPDEVVALYDVQQRRFLAHPKPQILNPKS